MGRITRLAYRQMIDEDIEWLRQQPRTLERDHIIDIVNASVDHEYPDECVQDTIVRLYGEIERLKAASRQLVNNYWEAIRARDNAYIRTKQAEQARDAVMAELVKRDSE